MTDHRSRIESTTFTPFAKIELAHAVGVCDDVFVTVSLADILFITGRSKRAIEDHFDRNFELEHLLETTGKHELLKEVQFASDLADIHYVRQRDPLGLGHAVSVARHHVGGEPFAVLLADDLMVDEARL